MKLVYPIVLGLFVWGCGRAGGREEAPPEQRSPDESIEITAAAPDDKDLLSTYYGEVPYEVTPSIAPYELPLAEAEVANLSSVSFIVGGEEARQGLLANGFVVRPYGEVEDFAEVYRELSDMGVPLFVTADTWLHLYHIQFDEILKELEETLFYADIVAITDELLKSAEALHAGADGLLREAARRNMAFLWVARELLTVAEDPSTAPEDPVPAAVKAEVEAELALIEAHQGFSNSPLFVYKEDYSQYVPRGHYTRSETLKSYFKALMWYGRMTMLLKGGEPACEYDDCPALILPGDADVQTAQALLLTVDVNTLSADGGARIADLWGRIYRVTSFFVGLADDLTYYEYLEAIVDVLGEVFTLTDLTSAGNLFDLRAELALKRSPEIYGGTGGQVIWVDPGEEITPEMLDELLEKSKGFRLMGQRFIPDSYAMGKLVSPGAGELTGSTDAFTAVYTDAGIWVRGFPRGLDVMALLGSARARELLAELGDDAYTKYDESYAELEAFFDGLDPSQWHRNLYWGWLYSLKPLLAAPGPGTQSFMQTEPWLDKSLQTALASWAELRHDTILYAKQSYTPGFETSIPEEPPGYVEPTPEFYARLSALNRMTIEGLDDLGVLPDQARTRLEALGRLLDRMLELSVLELEGEELSEVDYAFIRSLADSLDEVLGGVEPAGVKTTIVADVHTDQNSRKVLEEGVGYVELLIAAYRLPDGTIAIGAGPVFSYYEFKHPMDDRLTDEKWRDEILPGPERPEQPPWTQSYRIE